MDFVERLAAIGRRRGVTERQLEAAYYYCGELVAAGRDNFAEVLAEAQRVFFEPAIEDAVIGRIVDRRARLRPPAKAWPKQETKRAPDPPARWDNRDD